MNKSIIVFGINKVNCHKLSDKLTQQGYNTEVSISTSNHLNNDISKIVKVSNGKQFILVFRNNELKNVTEIFHEYGIINLSVFPYDTYLLDNITMRMEDCIIPIDNTKPRLSFLDVEISEHCNLKCKGCLDFSNLVTEKRFLDLDLYTNNLLKLKEYLWGICTLHLQGGEPLTNPDFLEYVRVTHEIFPDCSIHIITNGLLVSSVDIAKLEELKKYNCTLNITQYPINRKVIKKIKKYLNKTTVVYSTSIIPKYIFAKKILLEPHKHPEIAYKNCLIKHCTGMQENYISPCMFPLHIYKLNKEFGCELPDNDKIDIYNIKIDGWELIKILEEKPINFCSYCHYGIVPFFWKQQKRSEIKLEDWIIQPNLINSRLLPFFYKHTGSMTCKIYKLFSVSGIRVAK